ncbi:MAG: hypothetical protein ACRD4S_04105 [Candidatus Acidiferrales bacterium]
MELRHLIFEAVDRRGEWCYIFVTSFWTGILDGGYMKPAASAVRLFARSETRYIHRWLLCPALTLLLFASPALAGNRSLRQAQPHQVLGSLTATGPVYVNGSPAPPESTIFSGDVLSTADGASATFTISGKGSYKIGPLSQLAFTGDPQYVAELKLGTVVMSSFAGATEVTIRAGNFIVGPVIQTEKSASKIEREPDGSFTIVCLDGSVGLVPLEGTTGRVLQARQSVAILTNGELDLTREATAQTPPAATAQTTTAPAQTAPQPEPTVQSNNRKWLILALVGGGAAAGIAVAASSHGGAPPVSPSAP